MEAVAKTLTGTLNPDAQVGFYEFHREDVAHPLKLTENSRSSVFSRSPAG